MFRDPYGAIQNGQGKGIPKVTLPLGTVVIRKRNGTLARFVKTKMGGDAGRRWTHYARWWWEKNRGPVPPGKLVIHADGDQLNDDPKNFVVGTPGVKLDLIHKRDPEWSRWQHRRAARKCGDFNRARGRANRASNFLKTWWYPVVDEMSVILNVPFRKRKRLLAGFGVDVSGYPMNGHGKKPSSRVQRALKACPVRPTKSAELSLRRYSTYCLVDPLTRSFQGPISARMDQVVAQLERMGIWTAAEQCAKKDLKARK